ncbi:hypothetical protein ASPCAL03760 [Aspergillus calidoustus]|uniref:Uncharacterized protein n=1 Tax=Aspergillus calidoustus TaxID=454130 RepID=A0A0U5FSS0_ASPCI|nr:hypothetical protein ASPCAL03760 [Aspergillus calidoustus]
MASSTITSTAPSSTTCNTPAQYELPVHDASCGIPNANDKYKEYFENCAAPAAVREYNHECALWAPAVDQSVQDLIDCLYKAGVEWGDVWCSGDVNGTATGSGYPTATRTSTSTRGSETGTAARTSSADGAEETGGESDGDGENAAVAVAKGVPRVVALGLLGLVVSGVFGFA